MKKLRGFLCFVLILGLVFSASARADKVPGPSFKDVLSLKSAGSPVISPDGKHVLFTVRRADWENNRYDSEIWLSRNGEEPFQLTRTQGGSSGSPSWSPDGKWIAFTASRDEKQQVYLINPRGGEAFKLTEHKEGVNRYEWSPCGERIAFSASEPESEDLKKRKEQYGRFEVEDAEYRMTHLWMIDVKPGETPEAERLTSGEEFTTGNFDWSPDGKKIAFDHQPDPLISSSSKSDISILDVESGEIIPLVTQPGGDGGPQWSPDGKWIAFSTKMGDRPYFINSELARIPSQGGKIEVLSGDFDENPYGFDWTGNGIFFIASDKVFLKLYHLDPETENIKTIPGTPENLAGVSFTEDGNTFAFTGYDRTTLPEVYMAQTGEMKPKLITGLTSQVADWATGTREVITWESKDGTPIEGILWKPADFNPDKKYPVLVSIHGGPAATSRPVLVSGYVYPLIQWLEKGALILQPNYRGSAGYGEEFRSLNVRNLGVGDMWDVESGIQYLIDQGMAEPGRLGAMGWSQGGYISAFLATHSTMFDAISVGAGISNWVTYYVNTDIHPFTRHYLEATPWEDMAVYEKTSPITYITQAETPTLIQHGEFDRRVPIPNAYELFQGLQDMDVPAKLIVYKDFGHGITRPKEQLAAMWHNWQWFAKHIWNEELEIPVEAKEDK
ncbi:MAG: S9 family peptidase [Candidatus Aminicenantes bacterium]